MSDSSTPPDATGEALSRLAAFGEKKPRARIWGPLVLVIVLLVPLSAVAWLAWRQADLQSELSVLRADNATLQQLSATSAGQAEAAQRQQEEAQRQQEDMRRQLQEAQQRQQELDTTVQQTLEQELAASEDAVNAQAEQLAALEAELAALRSRLNALDTGGSPLTEAEVLLRFAQQRLVLARDTATAIQLFLEADALLQGMSDPAIVNVRETLAREVGVLQALPPIDVSGLFAQLSAEAARVETFDVVSDATVQDFTVTPAATAELQADDGWWARAKRALGEYFVVTHNAGPVVPQLSAEDEFQLRALVQLHIEQAKLALLRGDAMLYRAALDDALAASQRWLRSDDGSFDAFRATLTTLRDTPIVADIPPADQTLAALRRLSGTNVAAPATGSTR